MKVAVISDVHANLAALEAVLAAIDDAGDTEELWCLGDLTGYGADPARCTQVVLERADVCLAGNHDMVITGEIGLEAFSSDARTAAEWTMEVLAADGVPVPRRRHAQVEEAGAGDLDRVDVLRLEPGGDPAGDVPRRGAKRLGQLERDRGRVVAMARIGGPLEPDRHAVAAHGGDRALHRGGQLLDRARAHVRDRNLGRVRTMEDDDAPAERHLNIHFSPEIMAGVYANFANVSHSDYEFTVTFARVDHEVEEDEIPGVVVARLNLSARFMKELIDAMTDNYSKWRTREGIKNLPEIDQ